MAGKILKFNCPCGRKLRLRVLHGKLKYEWDEKGLKESETENIQVSRTGVLDVLTDFVAGTGRFALDVETDNIENDISDDAEEGEDPDEEK